MLLVAFAQRVECRTVQEHPELPVTDVLICGTSRPVPAIILETTSGTKKRIRSNISLPTTAMASNTSGENTNQSELMARVLDVIRQPLKDMTATLPSFFPLREDRVILLPPHRKFPRSVKDVIMRYVVSQRTSSKAEENVLFQGQGGASPC